MKEENVIRSWSLSPRRPRPDIAIEGSPERCEFRTVVEDREHRLWVLERIIPRTTPEKLWICETLEHLHQQEMAKILPYRRTIDGEFLAVSEGGHWLLRAYLAGTELPRPEFIHHGWRGEALARFLIDLREKSSRLPARGRESFALEPYIRQLLEVIWEHKPGVAAELQPAIRHLEQSFFPLSSTLPSAFCHGDYHPINVIWAADRIGAVIDWEFTGSKPELYDAANLLGCTGFENPGGLTDRMSATFVGALKSARFAVEESWRSLPDLILAIRFGWISEWLRKQDQEMLELELLYMNLILEHREKLARFFLDPS